MSFLTPFTGGKKCLEKPQRGIVFSCCIFFTLRSFNVVLFSYCILFKLHYFHVALFPCSTLSCRTIFTCCTLSMLHFFMLHFFHFAFFSCCTLFMLHFFPVAIYSGCTLFSCSTFALLSCSTLFMLLSFSYCTLYMLQFFQFGLSVLICFMLYSFHVKFFRCYTFLILWLFPCCTLFIMHTPIAIKLPCTQSSMKLRSYDVAVFSGCTFSCSNFFMLHSSVLHLCHVAPYLVVISFCYIFQKHLQIHFCLGYKLNKAVIGAKI